jgi:hypothetical protein
VCVVLDDSYILSHSVCHSAPYLRSWTDGSEDEDNTPRRNVCNYFYGSIHCKNPEDLNVHLMNCDNLRCLIEPDCSFYEVENSRALAHLSSKKYIKLIRRYKHINHMSGRNM